MEFGVWGLEFPPRMKKTFRVISGSVTAPKGFRAAAAAAGIKRSGKPDVALIVSDVPAVVAGTFTSNRVKAAPLKVSIPRIARGLARAIIVNSGNANCCTGAQGIRDAKEMCVLTAAALKSQNSNLKSIFPHDILVCSTGHIGRPMPMDKIRAAIPVAVAALDPHGGGVERAIMTTDTFSKTCAVEFRVAGKTCRIGGICKGAGMIAPKMQSYSSSFSSSNLHATMLCFITTDVSLPCATLQRCLNDAVSQSFNCITVDGDMSTNDTVLLLANGASAKIQTARDRKTFLAALNHVTLTLAKMIARDGEGATKLVTIRVEGAKTDTDAALAARAIAESPLNKCSFAGGDPNWGRLMDALGYSGTRVNEAKVEIRYNNVVAVKMGVVGRAPSRGESLIHCLRKIVAHKEFEITLNLHLGSGTATMYTCDFTEQYVRENLGE